MLPKKIKNLSKVQVFCHLGLVLDIKHYLCPINIKQMRKLIILALITICPVLAHSQSLKGYYYNEQYQVYLYLNADSSSIKVPGQDIYGDLPGYFGSKRDSRLWLIVECERVNAHKAEIEVINDYGSEDFTATVKLLDDNTIVYEHKNGSTLKFPVNKKWQKIPSKLKFQKKAE